MVEADQSQEGKVRENFKVTLLVLLNNMLPNDNKLPKTHYEEKKILCPVGMEY